VHYSVGCKTKRAEQVFEHPPSPNQSETQEVSNGYSYLPSSTSSPQFTITSEEISLYAELTSLLAFFMVFPETHGALLNVFLAEQPYAGERYVTRRGATYSSMQALTDALTRAGLPDKEISSAAQPQALNTLKAYTLTLTQLEILGLAGPE
jgi:hypothetical protein